MVKFVIFAGEGDAFRRCPSRQARVVWPIMIARSWHGRVPNSKADAYHDYLLRTGLADYAATPGNRGVQVLRRVDGDITHYVIITLWESDEAIQAFAGEKREVARYYPKDDEFLLEREYFVQHYEVLDPAPAPDRAP